MTKKIGKSNLTKFGASFVSIDGLLRKFAIGAKEPLPTIAIHDYEDPDFSEYAKKFYKYRYEFSCRAENQDGLLFDTYYIMAEDNVFINAIHLDMQLGPHFSQEIIINNVVFKEAAFKELEQQYEEIKKRLENYFETRDGNIPDYYAHKISGLLFYEKNGINIKAHLLKHYFRDGNGYINYFRDKNETDKTYFSLWKRYLKVYDLHKSGLNWMEISRDYDVGHFYREGGKVASSDSVARNMVKRDYAEAVRLIKSATAGTFPL